MLVGQAKAIVRQWVMEETKKQPDILGAYFAGSTNWMEDDDVLPTASDIDVKLIVRDKDAYRSFFKQPYNGVILEVSYESSDRYASPDLVLSNYYTAKHFATDNVIYDPTGALRRIHDTVKREFPRRQWAQRRCEDVRDLFLQALTWLDRSAPYHEQVFGFSYALGGTPQMFAVADLQNPTVGKMAVLFAQVAAKYGHEDIHERWLGILGSAHMTRSEVEALTTNCIEAIEVAGRYSRSPFFGSTNLAEFTRPLVVHSIQSIIEQGYHREAALWLMWHHAWSQQSLELDAPEEERTRGVARLQAFLDALGITSRDVLYERHQQLCEFAPDAWEVTKQILDNNPDIVD